MAVDSAQSPTTSVMRAAGMVMRTGWNRADRFQAESKILQGILPLKHRHLGAQPKDMVRTPREHLTAPRSHYRVLAASRRSKLQPSAPFLLLPI